MRLFIAVKLKPELQDLIRSVQSDFRRQGVRGNYSPAENLHITLAFIGEYDDPDAVADAMESVSFAPFTLTMDRIGCFGDLWWTGLSDSPELQNLVRILRHALADADIPFDKKKFKAHITFLRRASAYGRIEPPAIQPVSMTVEKISLMRSDRGKNGMIYTEIASVSAV